MISMTHFRALLSYEISVADVRSLWSGLRKAWRDGEHGIIIRKITTEGATPLVPRRAFRVINVKSGTGQLSPEGDEALPTPEEVALHPVLLQLDPCEVLSFEFTLDTRDTASLAELVTNNFEMLTPFRPDEVHWCHRPHLEGERPYLFVDYIPRRNIEADLQALEGAGLPVDGLLFGSERDATLFFGRLTPLKKWVRKHSGKLLQGCLAVLILGLTGTMLDRQERHQQALATALSQRLADLRQLEGPGHAMVMPFLRAVRFSGVETPYAALLGFLQSSLPPEAFVQSLEVSPQSASFLIRAEFRDATEQALRGRWAGLALVSEPVSGGLVVMRLSFAPGALP